MNVKNSLIIKLSQYFLIG